MRAVRRIVVVVLPAALACNSIVGFDDFQKVSDVRSKEPDATEDEGDAGRTKGRDADAPSPDGSAPPSSCDPTKPFGQPVALAGPVNSSAFELAPSLMNDELTIVFQRTVGVEGGSVLVATRSSVDVPFGEPTELTVLSQGLDGVQQPTMTGDGLLVFFAGILGPNSGIYTASRASPKASFGNRRAFVEVNSSASESFPGLTGDGAELWLSIQNDVGKPRHLFRSVRDNLGQYGAAVLVTELASASSEAGVAFSADGLTIYFGSERAGGKGDSDIWTARRATMTAAFGPATPVAELNTGGAEYPGWLSPDNCRLYFGSDRQGGGDILVATRKP